MELSLVIPVWNDPSGLERLLAQAAELGLFTQVIVSDDASDIPPGPGTIHVPAQLADRILWLRSPSRRGAGHARNLGLASVGTSHVIFFDSDDLFAEGFRAIAAHATAEEEPFDFLIFRHNDSRLLAEGKTGTFPPEEKLWQAIGARPEPVVLSAAGLQTLCNLSAYPWNKIYRTDFLRANRIGCTEIMVHNDVELHWNSFILARRALASSITGANHFVQESGSRLTNRRGAERLDVFQSFHGVMARVAAASGEEGLGFLLPFTRFSWKLLAWVRRALDPSLEPELRILARRYFLESLTPDSMTLIAYADPAQARAINRLLQRGDLP